MQRFVFIHDFLNYTLCLFLLMCVYHRMAAAAASAAAGPGVVVAATDKKKDMNPETTAFLSSLKKKCIDQKSAFCHESGESYVDIGKVQIMPFRVRGTWKLRSVLQRTIRNVQLTEKMRGQGFLTQLIAFLAGEGSGSDVVAHQKLDAIQIEAVWNERLHASLSSGTFGGFGQVWHDQQDMGVAATELGHSFVWFLKETESGAGDKKGQNKDKE